MFGTNKKIGKHFFKEAKENQLFITTRFFTLQGEGPYRGHPAHFIRLAHCNLACSFCDTYFDSGEWKSFDSLLEEADQVIDEFFKTQQLPTPNWAQGQSKKMVLVITGGEPSLQDNLAAFLEQAQPYFQQMQIESNGICTMTNLPVSTTVVLSPKCLEKNGQAIRYLKPNLKALARADCLKFVMSAPEYIQYKAYSEIPTWAQDWAVSTNKPLFISPMNCYKKEPQAVRLLGSQEPDLTMEERSVVKEVVSFWEPDLLDLEKNQRNHEYAANYCMTHGFILNLQIHLFAGLA